MKKASMIGVSAAPRHLPTTGWLAWVDEQGCPYIDFNGNPEAPIRAQTTVTLPVDLRQEDLHKLPVLLVFEDQNMHKPIITGILKASFYANPVIHSIDLAAERDVYAYVDGKRIAISGQQEVRLECGQSSITLHKNGRIVIKGEEIVSHARQKQRIKGGNVSIN